MCLLLCQTRGQLLCVLWHTYGLKNNKLSNKPPTLAAAFHRSLLSTACFPPNFLASHPLLLDLTGPSLCLPRVPLLHCLPPKERSQRLLGIGLYCFILCFIQVTKINRVTKATTQSPSTPPAFWDCCLGYPAPFPLPRVPLTTTHSPGDG